METQQSEGMSSGVVWIVAICSAVATAPWFSGGQEPIALLLSGASALVGAYLLWRQPTVRTFSRGPLLWFYLAYAGWSVLSLAWTVNRYSSLTWIVPLLLAGIVFRLVYSVSREEHGRNRIVGLYLATAAVFSLYGLYLYLTLSYERFTGSFYWANPAAAYLIPAILISIALLLRPDTKKWLWIGLTLLFSTSFVLADSRAALVTLIVALLIYVAVTKLSWRQWGILVLTVLGAYALSTGIVQLRHNLQPHAVITTPGARLNEAASGESQSGSDRLRYIESALKITTDHPLFGTGAGTFGDVHPWYQGRVVSASIKAHNYFIQSLSELGIIGFIFLLLLLGAIVAVVIRGSLQVPGSLPLVLGLMALMMHAGLDIDMSFPAYLMLIAVFIGLLAGQRQANPSPLSWRVPVLALLLVIPIALLYEADAAATRGAIYQSNQDYAAAAAAYDRAAGLWVGNPDWINAAGINRYTLITGGSKDAPVLLKHALANARTAERLDPSDGQHYELEGRLLALSGDLAGAEKAFIMALIRDPYNHPEYSLYLAQTHLYQNRPANAIKTATAMLAQYPDDVLANRAADTTLRPTLANLAALAGNEFLKEGKLAEAKHYAALSLHLYPDSTKGRALQHQVELRAVQP